MKTYKLQSVTILEKGNKRDHNTATYRAVILSEDNEMWITTGYIRILDKISLEDCAWSALLYFIGENTASYKDYEVAFDRIVSPWDSLSYKER